MVEFSYFEIAQKSIALNGEQYEISVLFLNQLVSALHRELSPVLIPVEQRFYYYEFYKDKCLLIIT